MYSLSPSFNTIQGTHSFDNQILEKGKVGVYYVEDLLCKSLSLESGNMNKHNSAKNSSRRESQVYKNEVSQLNMCLVSFLPNNSELHIPST